MGNRYQIPKKNWKVLEDYFGKEGFKKFLKQKDKIYFEKMEFLINND